VLLLLLYIDENISQRYFYSSDSIPFSQLAKALRDRYWDPYSPGSMNIVPLLPLNILGTAANIYKDVPDLSISMDVKSSPLEVSIWALK
jgi:hypothetical protein